MSASGGAAGPSAATGGATTTGGFNVGNYYATGKTAPLTTNKLIAGGLVVVTLLGMAWILSGRKRKK